MADEIARHGYKGIPQREDKRLISIADDLGVLEEAIEQGAIEEES